MGNIPMNWYDDYPHIGYDLDGTKIMKPAKGDEVDKLTINKRTHNSNMYIKLYAVKVMAREI